MFCFEVVQLLLLLLTLHPVTETIIYENSVKCSSLTILLTLDKIDMFVSVYISVQNTVPLKNVHENTSMSRMT
jgi:hypothetical protein